MTDWFDTALGRRVLQEETLVVRKALDDVFGFDLLQIGHWGTGNRLLRWARTQHALAIAEYPAGNIALQGQPAALPLASDSIDAVMLPHTLELVDDPYAVLREAERILRPEGSLLICCFNPYSGWGLRRFVAQRLDWPAFPPGIQRMICERRLKDWVALLGIDVEKVLGYLGPVPWAAGRVQSRHRPRPALLCGAYLLKARKRTQTLTLLRPRWKTRPRVLATAPEPTTRVRG